MAPTELFIDMYNKEGSYIGTINDRDLRMTDVTVGQVLNTSFCINNGITEVSSTHGGEPLSHDADVRSSAGGSGNANLYDVSPDPVTAETITGFYLDGKEYQFAGGGGGSSYTAGNGIDITNEEIGLDGTYELVGTQGPAPSGFHVPTKDEWVDVYNILITTFSMAKNATTLGTYLKMPKAGDRSTSSASVSGVGSRGKYRSSTPSDADLSYHLYFTSSTINQNIHSARAYGYSIRCFKNSPVIPTSSWTTLYDGSSVETGAGVFYNAADGLISVSGDGVTWYTIMDKNLGATTVYNQGDTETDANCGYFYQWGNNYGFAHSGTITTSSTQVDASNYGPGNYYNSSTFIKGSDNWSSVQNDNLWGATSGTVSGNLVLGDKLYKIVISTTAPAAGTASNIITFVIDE